MLQRGTCLIELSVINCTNKTREKMKKWFIIMVFPVVLGGCFYGKTIGIFAWEDSNAALIEYSLPTAEIIAQLGEFISKDEDLVIWNEEQSISSDNNLIAFFESALIRDLILNDYSLLERDQDLLYRMMSETEKGYVQINPEKQKMAGNSLAVSSGSSSASVGAYSIGYSSNSDVGGSNYFENKYWAYKDSTSLKSAAKALSYRLVECGIVIEEKEGPQGFVEEVVREARTVSDIKLLDVATGSILHASRVFKSVRDTLEGTTYDNYKDRAYRNYHYTYPVVNGNPSQQKVTDDRERKKNSNW